MSGFRTAAVFLILLSALSAHATIFGSIRGIVHDPQHRPISGAAVTVKAALSEWIISQITDASGQFEFNAVPVGEYSVVVTGPGFANVLQEISVSSGSQAVLHIALRVAVNSETVTVSADSGVIATDSATPTTTVSRDDIARTPGRTAATASP